MVSAVLWIVIVYAGVTAIVAIAVGTTVDGAGAIFWWSWSGVILEYRECLQFCLAFARGESLSETHLP